MNKYYYVNVSTDNGNDYDYSFSTLYQAENKYLAAIYSSTNTYASLWAFDNKKGYQLIRKLELIDGMENLDGDQLQIFADTKSAKWIENCTAKLINEDGKPVKTGTYSDVVEWAYRHGYMF